MKVAVSLLTLALIATVPMYSQAEPIKQGHCNHQSRSYDSGKFTHDGLGKKGIPPYLAPLGLSDTQQDKIFELTYQQVPKIRLAQKQQGQLIAELKLLTNSTDFDATKAKLISEKLAVINQDMTLNRAITDNQIFLTLNPEQRKQLQEMKLHQPEGIRKSRFKKGLDSAGNLGNTN